MPLRRLQAVSCRRRDQQGCVLEAHSVPASLGPHTWCAPRHHVLGSMRTVRAHLSAAGKANTCPDTVATLPDGAFRAGLLASCLRQGSVCAPDTLGWRTG